MENEMQEPQRGRSRKKAEAAVAEKTPKSAKAIKRRRFIIMAVLEVFVLLAIFAYAYLLKQYSKIQRPVFEVKNVENTELTTDDIAKMKGYWNIAAFGVDSRDSSVGRGNNADVIMIVSINRENGEIRIASVFRDSYLSLANGNYNKINQAYAVGGPELAVKALNQNLDLNITDYVTFNWKAVATGINILGGVDIDLTQPEFKYINSYITETVKGTKIGSVQLTHAGMNHLDGIQAVAYARLRYMDNDYTRTERQRRVLELCVQKAKQADPATLSNLAGNLLSMVATSLTWDDGMSLATNVKKYSIVETIGFPMDRREINMGFKGACVIPNTLEKNVKDLHTFLFGGEEYTVSNQVQEIDNHIASDIARYRGRSEERKYKAKMREYNEGEETSAARKRNSNTEEETTRRSRSETEGGSSASSKSTREESESGSTRETSAEATDSRGNVITGPGAKNSSAARESSSAAESGAVRESSRAAGESSAARETTTVAETSAQVTTREAAAAPSETNGPAVNEE